MCGRFAVTTDPALLAEKIKAIDEATGASASAGEPNYNVAPTTTIATVVTRHSEPDDEATRRVRLMRWGLVPPWVKAGPDGAPDAKGPLLINARSEKVASSPAFRGSAKRKRCLVPMDGWYEWRANPEGLVAGKKTAKTPFFMHRGDGDTLFMAGLWSVWKPASSEAPLLSCTIITTDAVGELAEIHDRMPLILAEDDWDAWLCAASNCARSRRWSTVCATTGPNCSNRPSRSRNRPRCSSAVCTRRSCRPRCVMLVVVLVA
jgi:putative SOS response-associated peptidase YedK